MVKKVRKTNGHIALKNGVTVADIFDKYSSKAKQRIVFTRSGDTAVNDDGEDKSTGLSTFRYHILSELCDSRRSMSVNEVVEAMNYKTSYSSVRSAIIEMTMQGLTMLDCPPQPVVRGRRRPFKPTFVGRKVVRETVL